MIYLSNSSRTTFDSCPAKYYWNYIYEGGVELVEVRSTHIGKLFGECLHSALLVYRRGGGEQKVMEKFGEKYVELLSAVEGEKSITDGYTLLQEYMHRYPLADDYLVTDNVALLEVDFMLEIEPELIYRGVIDWMPKWNGERVVVDLKSTKYPQSGYNVSKPNNQLTGYCLAATEHMGEMVKTAMLDIMGTQIKKQKIEGGKRKMLEEGEERCTLIREPTERNYDDFMEFKEGLKETKFRLKRCMERDHWPKWTHSCPSFGGCDFMELCNSTRESLPYISKSLYRGRRERRKE